jgi:hypothetical protein
MKKLLGVILSALFFLVGCNDDSSILDPISDTDDASQLEKGRPILDRDLDDFFLYDSLNYGKTEKLGDKNDNDCFFWKSYTVDGDIGAVLYFYEDFTNKNGEYGRLNAVLRIPKGAFKGELTFDIKFFLDNYSMEMYPTPFVFDKPIYLDLLFYNVDLDPTAKYLDFAYIEGKGEKVNYKYKSVNIKRGNIFVWGAELHHFSRYGWNRTKESLKKDIITVID